MIRNAVQELLAPEKGTALASEGNRPRPNPRHPDSRMMSATVERIEGLWSIDTARRVLTVSIGCTHAVTKQDTLADAAKFSATVGRRGSVCVNANTIRVMLENERTC